MSVRHLMLLCVVAAVCLLPLTGCGDKKTDAGSGTGDSSNTTATE
jgi:uncharacterized lipoprotein YehR (DUF1307 family)